MRRKFSKLVSILFIGLGFYNCCEADYYNHFYIGGGISTLIANNTLLLFSPTSGTFQTSHDSGNSYGGQILVGYQKLFACHQFLAAEAGLRGMIGRSSGEKLNFNIN